MGIITTTIDPLSAGLIIILFDLIFVISESYKSLKLGMLSEVVFILISDSERFLLMLSNSWFSLMFDVNVDAFLTINLSS